jgi:integrase
MSTLRFTLRTDKCDKSHKCPIELIYQISGQRKKIFLEDKLHSINWDAKGQKAIYITATKAKKELAPALLKDLDFLILTESEVEDVNDAISSVKANIRQIETRFELDKLIYTAGMVMDKLKEKKSGKTKKEDHKNLVFDFMDSYIADHSTTREKGSLSVYKSVKNHLLAYQVHTNHVVRFDTIDYGFFQRFQSFLINHRGINNTTIAKALSTLKTFLGYARKQGIKVNDSYRDFIIKKEKLEVIALNDHELQKLLEKDLTNNKRLDRVRDVFCFSCATGFRYSDLEQLRWEHITNEDITLIVKKTKTELTVPLNKISSAILTKYREMARPLPMISGQKLNVYIKELCELVGINTPQEIVRFRGTTRESIVYPKHELIHIHTGRKTFVTLSLEKGMTAEQVMAITGHTDYKSFKRYVDITKRLTKTVMAQTWGAPNRELR